MPKSSHAHEQLEWAKQKLGEIDATLASLENSVAGLNRDARADVEQALAKIKTARKAFSEKADTLRTDAKEAGEEAYAALEAKWTDVELGFQDYLTAAAGQADSVRKALVVRGEAQRVSWQKSLDVVRSSASEAIERARGDIDAIAAQLAETATKAEANLGKVSASGNESWKVIQHAIEETRAVHERAWKKISESFAKLG